MNGIKKTPAKGFGIFFDEENGQCHLLGTPSSPTDARAIALFQVMAFHNYTLKEADVKTALVIEPVATYARVVKGMMS